MNEKTTEKSGIVKVGNISYFYGIDLGFKSGDSTAVSIVHREPGTNKIVVDYCGTV